MERRQLKNNRRVCKFFRWTKKSYAVFNSLHKIIEISRLRSSVVDSSIPKSNKAIKVAGERSDMLESCSNCSKSDERVLEETLSLSILHLVLALPLFVAEFGRCLPTEIGHNNIFYTINNSCSHFVFRLQLFFFNKSNDDSRNQKQSTVGWQYQ